MTTKISPEAHEVQSALERYEQALFASPLRPSSAKTKFDCAGQFVA